MNDDRETMTVAEVKESWDWQAAFDCAARDGVPRGVLGYSGSLAPVALDDLEEAIAISNGENDETSWIGAFLLKDGRYLFLSAWCDYTGWGCQDGGDAQVASDLPTLIRYAMGNEERARLGVVLDEVAP